MINSLLSCLCESISQQPSTASPFLPLAVTDPFSSAAVHASLQHHHLRATMTEEVKPTDASEINPHKQSAVSVSAKLDTAAARAETAQLVAQAQRHCKQTIECSKLARVTSSTDRRPCDQRAADVAELLEEDAERVVSLLDLSHQLAVS